MIELDLNPTPKKLREFGLFSLAGFGLLGILFAWRLGCFSSSGSWLVPCILWAMALICPLLGLLEPTMLRPAFILLTLLAFPIGWVVGLLVMGMLYFGIFTPVALFFRLTGRDVLRLRRPAGVTSFWIAPPTQPSAASYYRQS